MADEVTPTTLAARQAAILRAIVREYIRTGEPVGSKHVLDRARITVSSATVRNEMARLEELGFVQQPHTSAGRIPTDRGYRFVVDEIKPRAVSEEKRRALAAELGDGEPASVDELLHRASDLVARQTRHAAAVLSRRETPAMLRRLELFATGPHLANLVLIAQNGRVEQRILPLQGVKERDVDDLGQRLGEVLQGRSLDDAVGVLTELASTVDPSLRALLGDVAEALGSLHDAHAQITLGGVANLAGEADFERDELRRVYEALEHQTAMLEVLASAFEPVTVRIGSEVAREDLRSCSIVVANFGAFGTQGSVGVIGPTRMDYERVIATANTIARLLEGALGHVGDA